MAISTGKWPSAPSWIYMLMFGLLLSFVAAEECSSSRPCATGCCSKFGFCGTTPDHCGDGCQANCDFRLGCDKNNPCKTGCCSKFGFCGMGPNFCAPEVCVAGCDSKYDCDTGDGPEWAKNAKCPLNVCCSKFGFCGLTEEFCGKKKVEHKKCPEKKSLERVVGYYEGWGSRRTCNAFWPERIPLGVYSHINFAFATIDPTSFEVRPAASEDVALYRRVTALKERDPGLKVFIALGGWTFNDPGPTATTFSDIARSEDNQRKFIRSLVSFLTEYNFDGVDLDWEYPQAKDRSGRDEDFKNFPAFMANLKAELQRTSGRNGLSITLPASYWYLQHFDIVTLQKSVDFFNIMSYDLHGTWDLGNKWTGEYLNPHTNLTEIDAALDLLWRNDIDPAKVVLGLAFYARSYTVANRNCMEPGCLFASGSRKGRCSNEVGILLNSEIDSIVQEKGLKPKLYEKEAVKIVHWDDQWLSYDDEETLALKAKYAKNMCLGGVMVWAISHDTREAKYSLALATAASRSGGTKPHLMFENKVVSKPTEIKVPHPQCKWTNCGEPCPSDYQLMKRTDSGARDGEWMLDESGCNGRGAHSLCCPSQEQQPQCGWWKMPQRGGKCESSCPSGFTEVGSNKMYCDMGTFQSACCSLDASGGNLKSMALYGLCNWSESPYCGRGKCSAPGSTVLTESSIGSGGAFCYPQLISGGSLSPYDDKYESTKRKYCCDQSNGQRNWANCEWKNNIGSSSGGTCKSGCPGDKVRVAMRTCSSGTESYCCEANSYDMEKAPDKGDDNKLSPEQQTYTDALKKWTSEKTCPASESLPQTRQVSIEAMGTEFSSNLTTVDLLRAKPNLFKKTTEEIVWTLLAYILRTYLSGSSLTEEDRSMRKVWDDGIKADYPELTNDKLGTFLTSKDYPRFEPDGPEFTAKKILCKPIVFVRLIRKDSSQLLCSYTQCGTDGLCQDDFDEDAVSSSNKRGKRVHDEVRKRGEDAMATFTLEKRLDETKFICIERGTGKTKSINWFKRPFTSAGDWDGNNPIYDKALNYAFAKDCSNTGLSYHVLPDGEYYATEHIIEMQTMSLFFAHATASSTCYVDCDFFVDGFKRSILTGVAAMPGGFQSTYPNERIMEALGSTQNTANFVLLGTALNGVKSRLWRNVDPTSEPKMKAYIAADDAKSALEAIRDVMVVFNYLNDDYVLPKLKSINKLLRQELKEAADAWNKNHKAIDLHDCWGKWFPDSLNRMVTESKAWVKKWIDEVEAHFDPAKKPKDKAWNDLCEDTRAHLKVLKSASAKEIAFDTSKL